jgi:hypothetical protein
MSKDQILIFRELCYNKSLNNNLSTINVCKINEIDNLNENQISEDSEKGAEEEIDKDSRSMYDSNLSMSKSEIIMNLNNIISIDNSENSNIIKNEITSCSSSTSSSNEKSDNLSKDPIGRLVFHTHKMNPRYFDLDLDTSLNGTRTEFDENIFSVDVSTPALDEPEIFNINGSSNSLLFLKQQKLTSEKSSVINNRNNNFVQLESAHVREYRHLHKLFAFRNMQHANNSNENRK